VIVVDTSALMAILLAEDGAESCAEVIAQATGLQMSGGTMAECMVVAARRGLRSEMGRLMNGIDLEIVEVTADRARQVGEAYARWGKGFHPAGLNFGDCFAYALARERGATLLFVGDDFSRTDVKSAR
jgi:ribonuclease VapC